MGTGGVLSDGRGPVDVVSILVLEVSGTAAATSRPAVIPTRGTVIGRNGQEEGTIVRQIRATSAGLAPSRRGHAIKVVTDLDFNFSIGQSSDKEEVEGKIRSGLHCFKPKETLAANGKNG